MAQHTLKVNGKSQGFSAGDCQCGVRRHRRADALGAVHAGESQGGAGVRAEARVTIEIKKQR